jgi:hypothetical protein
MALSTRLEKARVIHSGSAETGGSFGGIFISKDSFSDSALFLYRVQTLFMISLIDTG